MKSVRLACVDDNGTLIFNTTEVDGRLALKLYALYVFVSRDDAYTGGDNDPSLNTGLPVWYCCGAGTSEQCVAATVLSRRNPKLARALAAKEKMLNMLSIILVFALSMSGVFCF